MAEAGLRAWPAECQASLTHLLWSTPFQGNKLELVNPPANDLTGHFSVLWNTSALTSPKREEEIQSQISCDWQESGVLGVFTWLERTEVLVHGEEEDMG